MLLSLCGQCNKNRIILAMSNKFPNITTNVNAALMNGALNNGGQILYVF
jgi:hypothetical protein